MRWLLPLLVATAAHAATVPPIGSDSQIAATAFSVSLRSQNPRVASDGSGYLTVWTDNRNVMASRIDGSGRLRDTLAVFIGHGIGPYDVTFASGVYFIAFNDSVTHHVSVARIGTRGAVLDTHDTGLAASALLHIVSDGSNVAVITSMFQRIALDGTPAGAPAPIDYANRFLLPVARHDSVLLASVYDTTYTILDWNGATIGSGNLGPILVRPTIVASDGGGFLVLSTSTNGYAVSLFDASGRQISGPSPLFTSSQLPVAIWGGTSYVCAAFDRTLGATTAYRIFPGGGISAPMQLGGKPPFAFASNPQNFMIADAGVPVTEIVFASPESFSATAVSTMPLQTAREQRYATAASTPMSTAVVWLESSNQHGFVLRAAFLSASAISEAINIDTEVFDAKPAIGTDGGKFLIAYAKSPYALTVRTISTSGEVGPPHTMDAVLSQGMPEACAVTWDGSRYVVAASGWVGAVDRDGLPLITAKARIGAYFLPIVASSFACDSSGCTAAFHTTDPFYGIGEVPLNGGLFSAKLAADLSTITAGDRLTPATSDAARPVALRIPSFALYPSGALWAARVPGDLIPPGVTIAAPPGTMLGGNNTNALAVVGNGIYWSNAADATSAQPRWSRLDTRGTPTLAQTVDLGDRMPLPVAATSTATTAFVFYESGDDDPTLLAPRFFVRAFTTPDPFLAPHQRAGGR